MFSICGGLNPWMLSVQICRADYYEDLYSSKLDTWEDVDKFLQTYCLPELNHEEIENLGSPVTSMEIASVIQNFSTNKNLGPDSFTGEFYQIVRQLIPVFLKLFQNVEAKQTLTGSFYKASITLISKPDKDIMKEKCKSLSLMNIDAKILNEILVKWMQQYIKILTEIEIIFKIPKICMELQRNP